MASRQPIARVAAALLAIDLAFSLSPGLATIFRAPAGFWAAVLTYIAIDDAWTIHERLGGFFAEPLDLGEILGLRAQDIGEMLACAIVGSVALLGLIVAERRSGDPGPSMLSRLMVALVGLLVFFAVVVDLVGGFAMPDLIGVSMEDGGELAAMTLILVGASIWTGRPDELLAEL